MEFSTKRQFFYLRLCEMDYKEYQLSLSKSDTGEVVSGDPINILIYNDIKDTPCCPIQHVAGKKYIFYSEMDTSSYNCRDKCVYHEVGLVRCWFDFIGSHLRSQI